jgi:hypothetical protein
MVVDGGLIGPGALRDQPNRTGLEAVFGEDGQGRRDQGLNFKRSFEIKPPDVIRESSHFGRMWSIVPGKMAGERGS